MELDSKRFQIIKGIGEGVHGIVFKAIDLYKYCGSGDANRNKITSFVAIKRLTVRLKPTAIMSRNIKNIPSNVFRELEILQRLKPHSNIIRLIGFFRDEFNHFLVLELMQCSLFELIHNRDDIINNLAIVKAFLKMLLQGVSFLHNNFIMHRDLKPSNLLISEKLCLKIADFGSSRIFFNDKISDCVCYTAEVTSRWYRAPEVLYGSQNYCKMIDIWSVGCIFAEMLLKKPLFSGDTDIEQLSLIAQTFGTPNRRNWPDVNQLPDFHKIQFREMPCKNWIEILPVNDLNAIDLAKLLLKYDPKQRIQATNVRTNLYI